MKEINPEHLNAIISLANRSPYFDLLSMKLREMEIGYARVEIDVIKKHLNPFGWLHGGVYSSIIDAASYWSLYCEMEEDAGAVSIDLNVDFTLTVNQGKITAEGKPIKIGRSILIAEASVKDERGKLLAHGRSKLLMTPGLQTISQAARGIAIPPKFL
ncbi:MAG: PaaI family thioesterase [Clostridiales bacterium]|jgi:uncharacterized protein (TIGR00369 family)|nr:PaaI family thioesterase [Clostridiales bacterium]